jgi:hypothetical protein
MLKTTFVSTITTAGAIMSAFITIGWKADEAFSEEARTALSRRLVGIRVDHFQQNWPAVFARVFDHGFGQRHLSATCMYRSLIASVLFLCFPLILVIVIEAINKRSLVEPVNELASFFLSSPQSLLIVPIYVVFFYVVLLKIRYILYWMIGRVSRKTSIVGNSLLTILSYDVSSGYFIWPFFDYAILWPRVVIMLLLNIIFDVLILLVFVVVTGMGDAEIREPSDQQWVLLALTSFCLLLPSFLLWLYAFSYLVFRILARMTPIVDFIKFILPIERYPFRSICLLSGVITSATYVLLTAAYVLLAVGL